MAYHSLEHRFPASVRCLQQMQELFGPGFIRKRPESFSGTSGQEYELCHNLVNIEFNLIPSASAVAEDKSCLQQVMAGAERDALTGLLF